MAEDFRISLRTEIGKGELENVRKQINGLKTTPINIELNFKDVQKQIDGIKKQLNNLGSISNNFVGGGVGSGDGVKRVKKQVDATLNAYKDLQKLQARINSTRFKIGGLDSKKNSSEITILNTQLNQLIADYNRLYNLFGKGFSTEQIDSLNQAFEVTSKKIDAVNAKIKDVKINKANDILFDLDTGSFESSINKIKTSLKQMSVEDMARDVGKVDRAIEALDNSFNDLNLAKESKDVDKICQSYEEYVRVLKEAQNLLSTQKTVVANDRLEDKKKALLSQMNLWQQEHSAARSFNKEIDALKSKLESCNKVELDGISAEFREITQQAKLAGKATSSWGDKIKHQFQEYSVYLSTASLILYGIQGMRSMYDNIVKVDSAMTELKKVTDETASSYETFLTKAAKRSVELGTSLDAYISSTADFSRLGYEFEDAQHLSEVANIYAVVGDEIADIGVATESVISTLTAFKDEIEDPMEIIDKFNEVGNTEAISSGGIGEALKRSASSLQAANATLDESIALITAANTVVQNSEKVGTAFKTISMRIRGAKSELQEAGLETKGMVESTSALRGEIMALSGVDIMMNEDTFKSPYKILDELSQKWEYLSDIQQASLTELLAGKMHGNVMASLMSNFDIARRTLITSMESEDSAQREHEKVMDSIEAKTQSLIAAWQSLSTTVMNSDFIKGGIDFLTSFVGGLENVIDKLGVFPTLIGGISAVMSAKKGIGLIGEDVVPRIIGLVKELGSGSSVGQAWANSMKDAADANTQMSNSAASGSKSFNLLGKSLNTAKIATVGLKAATALLNTALNFGLAYGLQFIITGVSKFINQQKELRESTIRSGEEAKKETDSILELYGAYKQSRESYLSNAGSKDSLTSSTDALLHALGIERSEIQSLAEDYRGLDNAISAVTQDALQAEVTRMTSAYGQAVTDLQKEYNDKFSPTLKFSSETDKSFQSYLKDSGIKMAYGSLYDTDLNQIGLSGIEKYEAMYDELLSIQALADKAVSDGTLSQKGISDSTFLKQIEERRIFLEEYLGKVYEYRDTINQVQSQAVFNDVSAQIGVPKDQESFDTFRESMIEAAIAGEKFLGTEEDIANAVDDFLSSIPALSIFSNTVKTINTATSEELELLRKQFKQADVAEWFGGLSESEKQLVFTINAQSDDSALWTVERWQTELKHFEEYGIGAQQSMSIFSDTLNGIGDTEGFSDVVENYITKIESLKEALSKIDSGEITETDIVDLVSNYPSLAPYINDTNDLRNAVSELIDETSQGIDSAFNNQLSLMGEEGSAAYQSMLNLYDIIKAIGETDSFNFDISNEIEKFTNLYNAIGESSTGSGLTSDSITNVEKMFSTLKGYDQSTLFEETEHGIHLNTTALRALQSQYEASTKIGLQEHLQDLKQEYNDTLFEIEGLTEGTTEYNAAISNLTSIENQIEDVRTLAFQYEGLTSSYNKWVQAQSSGEEGDMYDNITGSLENINGLYESGLVGTNAFRTAVQMMTDQDLSTASVEDLVSVYESGCSAMQRYFTDSSDGCLAFLEDVQSLNTEWAHLNEDGSWDINFGVGNDSEIATALSDMMGLQVSTEQVQIILRKLSDYGFDIKLDASLDSMDDLKSRIEITEEKLLSLGQKPVDIDVNADDIDSEIESAKKTIEDIENSDVDIKIKDAQLDDANAKLDVLTKKKLQMSQPAFMDIDVNSVEDGLSEALQLLQDYQTALNEVSTLEIKGADTNTINQAMQDVDALAIKIAGLPSEVKTKIGFEATDDPETIKQKIAEGGVSVDVFANTTDAETSISGLDTTEVVKVDLTIGGNEALETLQNALDELEDKEIKITASVIGTTLVNGLRSAINRVTQKTVSVVAQVFGRNDVEELKESISTLRDKTVKVTNITNNINQAKADGTTYANGTAFSQGNWGTKDSGTGLMGEVGAETLVRDGKYYIVGEDSAEFVKYRKGDIIFNAEQTKELFEKGKITKSKKRGKSFAHGTVGKAFSSGTGTLYGGGSTTTTTTTITTTTGGGVSNNSSSSSSNAAEDFKETFDWIEIMIDRIERAISTLDLKATSVYRNWSVRNENLTSEISKIGEEIDIQSKGYDRYIQEANSVGLSEDWAKKVRDGKIDIETITDKDLAEKIKNYQTWYEKAVNCRDAVEQLRETESSLYKQSFDNVVAQYDSVLQGIEHQKSMLDEYISQSEERGYIVSIKYYKELKKRERDSILKLEEERNDMQVAFDNAIQSGTIAQYSEAWWEMKNSIDDVTLSIEEGHTALIEFDNAIRDINWGIFDLMQDRMSRVSKEFDFLISLFETNKLYKESGQLTNEGLSTMGSHAVNYNVYMSQADKYAREISKLESEINNDPFNQTLIDRKHELIDLQQEMILNAESEKNAIVDMVREGIELELNSLNELIDTYNEALDAEKDLYEYQKNVSNQSRNMANIQKQLSAYQGDNSEETRLKVQELKSALNEAEQELRETEYDKYTSDQKELLDSLYSEYESILNARLDNVDLLVGDMIQTVNDNSSTINNTITSKADSLGYALMSVGEIWNTDFGVVSMYGAQTVDKLTSLESYLSAIASNASSILNSMEIQSKMNAVVGNKDGVIRGLASLDGYASGAKHIKSNKYAWTQENGREFIIRPSDGAILTPVATGDSVLSNSATNNLWDLANNPHSFIQNSIKTNSSVMPVSTAGSVSYNQTLDKVVFNLPNVKNYEELLSSMQRDKNFENLILAMTVDRIAGKSLLGKGKAIR